MDLALAQSILQTFREVASLAFLCLDCFPSVAATGCVLAARGA